MKLKNLRIQKGLSQREMALRLSMTEQNYRNYERGAYVAMSEDIEKQISEILGIEFKYESMVQL